MFKLIDRIKNNETARDLFNLVSFVTGCAVIALAIVVIVRSF